MIRIMLSLYNNSVHKYINFKNDEHKKMILGYFRDSRKTKKEKKKKNSANENTYKPEIKVYNEQVTRA